MKKLLGGERNGDGCMDRISQLPQHILQHVLSFLSQKEAVQTSLLSKSWRYLWCTRPNVEFRESRFTGNKETFMSVLDKTLQGYHDQMLCIQEFCVEISNIDSVSESIPLLEKWIPIVTMNMRLKTFNLSFSSNVTYFDLPVILVVFESEFLQKLYLKRCMLSQKPLDKVLSKHLKTLSLKRVYVKDETFEKIMSSCPFIEYVVLHKCEGLRIIKVNKGHNLKHFDFDDYRCNYIIKIDVPTIETIKIGGFPNWCDHRKYFPHLKSLHLKFLKLSAELFNNFSSNFPCLEELSLLFWYGLEEFHLFSRSIKHLILALLGSIKAASLKATIDAPNIVKFEYEGDIPGSISFTTTSTKWKSNIMVHSNGSFDDYTSSRCLKINELLKALSQSEISVNIANPPLLVLDGDGGLYEPVAVENLSLSGYYWSFSSHARFLNCLFCVCHPRYVYAHPSFDEFLTEREMRHYFWQRDLEEVSVEAFDDNVNEWNPECGLPGKHTNIRFRLKWRELSYLP